LGGAAALNCSGVYVDRPFVLSCEEVDLAIRAKLEVRAGLARRSMAKRNCAQFGLTIWLAISSAQNEQERRSKSAFKVE
jgi:hypothetical protein